ncbi:hypothetical protein CMV_016779 [Castanea mollissima]|uniref:Myb-like domain-containing protein n=1 Tax=Castanea mollissima TaxID=60419 RepID=A0A8J4QTY7_9ROSI|nr:hypothetical protein CMV_016779 [Castanea mollissima]
MGSPNPNPNPSPSTTSKPLPWTHEETVHLIQAYQEKWYSLKRGQLKASNWEEVAVTVSARCGYDHSEPSSKSALQCRHKIEKLRQRYRSESQQRRHSSWPYFPLMDSLHRGPLPISARPPDNHNNNNNNNSNSNIIEDEDEDDNESDEENIYSSRSRSINYLLRKPTAVNRFAGIADAGKPIRKRHRDFVEEENGGGGGDEEEEEEEEEVEEKGRDAVVSALAVEIRKFAERFIGMENMKMEMMKDTERFRMEMENKRMELILDSQKRILDSIHRTFASP